jgi:hypothetical protein
MYSSASEFRLRVSVVMPAYNEAEGIADCVLQFLSVPEVVSSLFSGSYERVLIICFPGVLILALNGFENVRRTADVSGGWVLMLPVLLFPINLLFTKRIETFFEVQALVLILFVAAMLQWRRHKQDLLRQNCA